MSLAALQGLVNDLVRDKDQVVSSATIDQAIADAVLRYSTDRPRDVVVDVVSPLGGREFPLPMGWQAAFSMLRSMEFPPDSDQFIDLGQVRTRIKPIEGFVLSLPIALQPGDQIRVVYTQQHVVDADSTTIPETHRFAVACWAASVVCGMLASYYASEGMPTIAADSADHMGKTERYRARAKDLAAQYFDALGINPKKLVAAGTVTAMKGTDSRGRERLFHSRRYRD